MGPAKRQLAFDTNFLFDFGAKAEFALNLHEELLNRGYDLLIPPTVVVELSVLSEEGTTAQRKTASIVFETLHATKFLPLVLSDGNLEIAEQFRRKMSKLRLIPDEEWNDGLILAEAALGGVPLLATSDEDLLGIDDVELQLALAESGIPAVHAVHPKLLLRAFR
jgi:predicted nucleic acid-binding protein